MSDKLMQIAFAPRRALEQLFWLRSIAIVSQIAIILAVHFLLGIPLPTAQMWIIVGLEFGFNLFVAWRLVHSFPATELEVSINLALDAATLAALLYWSGGSTNPFVSLFLVPIALGAAFLPLRHVVGIAAWCILLYTLLMFKQVPLPPVNERFGGDFNLHVFGMWASFILSGLIAMVFVSGLARLARRRDRELAEAREEMLRNEHLVAMGTLAAGAAHEISTPLSTIGMIAEELRDNPGDEALVGEHAETLQEQANLCRQRLASLVRGIEEGDGKPQKREELDRFIDTIMARWGAMRPEIEIRSSRNLTANPNIVSDETLAQALINLLNNAADASLANGSPVVEARFETSDANLTVEIDDHGKGLSPAQARMAGKVSFSTKQDSMGIGLVLSHATLSRLGGSLVLQPGRNGQRTRIVIPLPRLATPMTLA